MILEDQEESPCFSKEEDWEEVQVLKRKRDDLSGTEEGPATAVSGNIDQCKNSCPMPSPGLQKNLIF